LNGALVIAQPDALLLAASSATDVSCFAGSDGSVTVGIVSNAIGTVSYSWTNASNTVVGTTASVNGLPVGTYTVTVTDNCFTRTNSVIIGYTENAVPVINCPSVAFTRGTNAIACSYLTIGTEFNVTAYLYIFIKRCNNRQWK